MIRALSAAALSLVLVSSVSNAQDGPLRRAGRALDQTGKNIRSNVESEVARGQITAQERDVLNRVGKRIDWDKKMAGSTLRVEVQPGRRRHSSRVRADRRRQAPGRRSGGEHDGGDQRRRSVGRGQRGPGDRGRTRPDP